MDKIILLACSAAGTLHAPSLFLTLGLVSGSLGDPLFSLPATFCIPQGPSRLGAAFSAACHIITLTAPEGRPYWTTHDQTPRHAKSSTFAGATVDLKTGGSVRKTGNILMNELLSHDKHAEVMNLHSSHSAILRSQFYKLLFEVEM